MSRYVERAENIARILDVNLQLMLDMPSPDPAASKALWEPVLRSTGDGEDFYAHHKEPKNANVIEFLTLNPKNPNSIINCITRARENARHVREQISLEMWEEINRTYLDIKKQTLKKILNQGPYEFFSYVKNASHLFQGITDGTMTHGEEWDFIQVGKYLERADMTTRILDANDEIFIKQPANRQMGGTLQWSAILRSCSSHDALSQILRGAGRAGQGGRVPHPQRVFPALDPLLPRRTQRRAAIHFRLHGRALHTNRAEKLSGRLVAELNYSALEDIKTIGMHRYMDELQVRLNEIGEAIYRTYLFSPPVESRSPKPPGDASSPAMTQVQSLGPRPQRHPDRPGPDGGVRRLKTPSS